MKIEAKTLNNALSILGLSTSKELTAKQITKVLELSSENGFLYGYTMDKTNIIKYKICPISEDFYACVLFTMINDIIKKCTDIVELTTTDNALKIKANNIKCSINLAIADKTKSKIPKISENATKTFDISSISEFFPHGKAA